MKRAPDSSGQFVGAAGCKSSSCHGGAGERSQYLTWTQYDFHARAYAILTNARSARMAESLGPSPATMNERCTVCHSPFQSVAPARLTSGAQTDEGVSCENCHSAASGWLRGHTRKDWTYATRVDAGMHDLRNLYVRANTCVACHQNIDADILAAGHPELVFELDGQTVAEPKHWMEDEAAIGPRAWLVGQAVALREISWALATNKNPTPELRSQWNALVWLLAKATADQTRLPTIAPPNENADAVSVATTQQQADSLARQAAAVAWDDLRTKSILQALGATESDFASPSAGSSDLLLRRAVRLVLALDRLARALDHREAPTATSAALTALYDDVRAWPFQSSQFAAHLANFRKTIEAPPQ